jgi:hypothetical protein
MASRMTHHTDWYIVTNVLAEGHSAFIFKVKQLDCFTLMMYALQSLENIGNYLPVSMP